MSPSRKLLCVFLIVAITGSAVGQSSDTEKRVESLIEQVRNNGQSSNAELSLLTVVEIPLTPRQLNDVTDILLQRQMEFTNATWTRAVRRLAKSNPVSLVVLLTPIERFLQDSTGPEMLDLIIALRGLQGHSARVVDILQRFLRNSNDVLKLHAAVTILALNSTDAGAEKIIESSLTDHRPAIVWRTALAMCDLAATTRWNEFLKTLLSHTDCRVRVASAFAYWRLTENAETTVPVLVAAIADDDKATPVEFTFPSTPGISHRIIAIMALQEIGQKATGAIPALEEVITTAVAQKLPIEAIPAQVAIRAIQALPPIAGSNPELAKRLAVEISVDSSLYQSFSEVVDKCMEELMKQHP
ncbi:MAG: hypothetical protein KDB03_24715 [Planctomycetales bacterium]|nr:hypothetical protein [Planctomycetales bacterium]